jgi:hypothetical protein
MGYQQYAYRKQMRAGAAKALEHACDAVSQSETTSLPDLWAALDAALLAMSALNTYVQAVEDSLHTDQE